MALKTESCRVVSCLVKLLTTYVVMKHVPVEAYILLASDTQLQKANKIKTGHNVPAQGSYTPPGRSYRAYNPSYTSPGRSYRAYNLI